MCWHNCPIQSRGIERVVVSRQYLQTWSNNSHKILRLAPGQEKSWKVQKENSNLLEFWAHLSSIENLLSTHLSISPLAWHKMIQSQETEEGCTGQQHLPDKIQNADKKLSTTNFHRLRGWRMSNLGYCLAQSLASTEWRSVWLLGVSTGVACVWAPVRLLLALQYRRPLTYHVLRYCLQCWRLSWIHSQTLKKGWFPRNNLPLHCLLSRA